MSNDMTDYIIQCPTYLHLTNVSAKTVKRRSLSSPKIVWLPLTKDLDRLSCLLYPLVCLGTKSRIQFGGVTKVIVNSEINLGLWHLKLKKGLHLRVRTRGHQVR